MEGVTIDLLYSTTPDGKRPTGMQPVGTYPDILRATHRLGVVVTVPCGRSQIKARNVALEMIEWALTAKGLFSPSTDTEK
jgi:protein subunit release factor A